MAHRFDSLRHAFPGITIVAALTIASACSTDTDIGPDAGLDSLYVEPQNGLMVLDDTLHLIAIGVDSSGRRFATTRVAWSSGDPTISLSSDGAAIGVAVGPATVQARAGAVTATASLMVQPKPVFALSLDSVQFSAFANGPAPASQALTISNGGGGTLAPVVDSIRYGAGAAGWLQTAIATGSGTDTLTLAASVGTLGVGSYTADVFMGSPKAAPKAVRVRFAVGVDAPATIAIDSGDGQTATVNTAVPVRPTVALRDQYDNPVPGAAVTFSVIAGGGAVAPLTSVTTDGAGKARVTSWTLGTSAGANALRAASSGVSPVVFNATATAGAPATAAKDAGDGQSVTVNTAVPVKPAVRVSDQFGNPVESVTATFGVASGGGSLTGGTSKTDGAGLATVGSWTLGTVAGPNTLTGTVTGLPVATFSATGTADVADSIKLFAGNNQTDTVRSTLGAYQVRVADRFGNGVPGTSVTWAVTGGGSITPSSTTNAGGIAAATRVFGSTAGPQNATATAAGLVGSPVAFSATATHGAATTIVKASGDSQSATAGSPVAIPPTARVTDQYGNPVSGVGVTFAVTAGGGSVAPGTAITTTALGNATVTSWTLGPAAGTNNNTLTAAASGLPPAGFVASGLSGAAQNLVYVSGTGQTDTIGATLAPYTVRVTDVNGNGVQGVTVSWVVTAGGGSITASSVTDVNGFASATRVLGTTAGVDSARASVGVPNGSPQRFGAVALPGNASQILKTAGDGQSATVNTAVATAPQVQITDRAGNPVAGWGVTVAVSGGGGSITPSPANLTTNASGFAQITSWTLGTAAGANVLSATSSGTPGATFSATGTPGAPSASQSTVVDNAASITACSSACTVAGATADSVTVTVRDQFNNLVSGATVVVSATGINNTFSPAASGTSNAGGVFATKLNSTTAQAKTISATANAVGITQTAAVTVNPAGVSAAQSSLGVGTASITACSTGCVAGSTASTITITVRDAFGNTISGASVSPAASGGSNTFTPASGSSNASGVFSTAFNSTLAQGKTISATANAVGITQTGGVTVTPAAAASIVINGGNSQSARVGTGILTAPSVLVRDAFLNPVPNVTVTFAVTSGGGSAVAPTTPLTNASGIATAGGFILGGTNADDAFGRMSNSMSASASGAGSTTFTEFGIYTWSGDAAPVIGPSASTCSGCHSWNRNPNNIVNVASSCAGWNYVAAGAAGSSYIYTKMAGTQACGGNAMPPTAGSSAANLKIIRAWINNGALNN